MTGVDEAEKDWRLFDIWDRRFDKLPVISSKLSVHVTDTDMSGKEDAFPISELASSSSELRRVQRLHVISADKSGKEDWPVVSEQAQLLRKLTPLRFLNWPLRILSSPLRSLKSRRVLIFIEARSSFQSTLEFSLVETPFLHF
ncbi:hypothetical protein ACFX2A_038309 [Malus domestica]